MVEIVPLDPDHLRDAALVLARAFVTNPLHRAVFKGDGPKQLKQNHASFTITLSRLSGEFIAALDGEEIVGVMRSIRSPGCRPTFKQRAKLTPFMMFLLGPICLRLGEWLSIWAKHDPDEPHRHLGPVGVLPGRQGEGIGSRLMQAYIDTLDAQEEAGYLETDRRENIRFYENFGFTVREEVPVLGLPTWLMWRPARKNG
jgi:GNAT superfamily N-acetyltransferase